MATQEPPKRKRKQRSDANQPQLTQRDLLILPLGPLTKFTTLSELCFANRPSRKIDAKPTNVSDRVCV